VNDHALPDDLVLSESQVRDVIERAVRAEARSDGTSIAMLRQIAQELEIDPVALERALHDVVGLPVKGKPIRSWISRRVTRLCHAVDLFLPRKGRLVAGLMLGGSLGWLSAHIAVGLRVVIGTITGTSGSAAFIDVPIAIVLILLTLANSLSRRLDGHFVRYLAETGVTAGAFASAWALTAGRFTIDLATGVALYTAAAAVWGWFVVRRSPGSGEAMSMQKLQVPSESQASGESTTPSKRAAWKGLVSPTMIGLARP